MQLAFKERCVVLLDRILNRVVIGIVSLDQHSTGQVTAASAAGYLGEQLEGTLGGAEIRHAERSVRADHSDQSDAMKIVALRQHLCPDQNIQCPACKGA